MGWKYIMVLNKIGDTSFTFPVIFPDKLVHSQVYSHVKSIMPGWHSTGVKVLSAGKIEHLRVEGLGGKSETLNINSRLEDADIINNYSYFHGVI